MDPNAEVILRLPISKQEQKRTFLSRVSWVHGFAKERMRVSGAIRGKGTLSFSLLLGWPAGFVLKELLAKDQTVAIAESQVMWGAQSKAGIAWGLN